MLINEILTIYELLDRPGKPGRDIAALFAKEGQKIEVKKVKGNEGFTEFIKIVIKGKKNAPVLGIIGRLGGIGARPAQIGFVSDGDGALTALSVALKLARMKKRGDVIDSTVIIATHVCTDAPTEPHDPVPFMGSPVDVNTMNEYEVDKTMDAVLSIDTSRGNKIINTNSFAISPTVKEGWILKVSDGLLDIMSTVTADVPKVLPISMQDITPYGNDIYHFNSIMQPAIATNTPVVGIAITGIVPVAGCATGVTNISQIDAAGRFAIEVAQAFSKNNSLFYDRKEFGKIKKLYGTFPVLQTKGKM